MPIEKTKKVKISHFQLASLLAVSALFNYTSVLPILADYSMGRFISLTVSTAVVFALYLPLLFSSARDSSGTVTVNNTFFKWVFSLLLIARILYTAVLSLLQLEFFVANSVMPYLSTIFFMAIILVAVWYGTHKGVQSTARIAPIALFMYIFVIFMVSISVWAKADTVRLYSPFAYGISMKDVFADVIRNDELFFFAALSGFVRGNENNENKHKQNSHKSVLYYLPFILVAGLWLNLLYNVVLGRFIGFVHCPMYTVASLSSFNIIERMDGFFITAEVIGGVLKITLCFVCIRAIMNNLFVHNIDKYERSLKIATGIILFSVIAASYFLVGRDDWLKSAITEIMLCAVLVIISAGLGLTSLFKKRGQPN
jgi:hypothetical protein